ncbi:NADH:ubiquinone oxidoreductase [Tilletia horrida]|uniref:NADH:ubiquinone oxidoreductase n=1 Tax=Tilletia horrida TaxID=155126 RepID=A0AAN6JZY9_9BASI|nr:NADH:ubiquinone oxidoreductase [Tilletia horrida]KAK0569085.1 NADH:ubiquinone oxidoreductase [Tilletia horrida]
MGHDDDEGTPSFSSPEEEIRHWKSKVTDLHDTLNETEATLQDFMESSKELEAEMEREISASNRRLADLQNKNEAMRADVDNWKNKYQNGLTEHNKALADLNKELEVLRESHNIYKTKVRDMELVNDELESAERMVQSSLADMEGRYNNAMERTALLEEELVTKATLEEENQRLKDEIRELNEELAVVRNMTPASVSRAQSRADAPERQSVDEDRRAPSVEADLNLSDLVINRPMSSASSASVGQQSTGSAPRTDGVISPNMTMTAKSRPPLSSQNPRSSTSSAAAHLNHSRRGSRDVRGFTLQDSYVPGAGGSRASAAGVSGRPSLQSTRLSRPLGSTTTARRSGVSGSAAGVGAAGGAGGGNSGGAQRMVQDMMARMKTLESRINSARNLSRLPQSTLASSTSSRYGLGDAPSAIPRPSSRLGSSTGPGAGGMSVSSSNNFTPRASASASMARRDSVDGRPGGSAIPIPSGGLARSTIGGGPRPSSRLSDAGRDTPPLPNNNNGAVSPSDEQFFASGGGSTAGAGGGLYKSSITGMTTGQYPNLNRKRSGTGGASLGAKPRGSGSALPLPSGAGGGAKSSLSGLGRLSSGLAYDRGGDATSDQGHERISGSAYLRSTTAGSASGHGSNHSGGGIAGPPSSWMTRVGAVPPPGVMGSSKAGASSAGLSASTTTSTRPRSASGARSGSGSIRR